MENREGESMFEEEKMFTCLTDAGDRVDGAIEVTKEQVLSWMKNAFPGLRKSEDQEVDTIWAFFRPGEAETYETPDGNKVYLAESFFEVESARE